MNLDRDEITTAYNCLASVMRGFTTAPPPWAVQRLYDKLNTEYRTPSQSGQEKGCTGEQLEAEQQLLSSRQVAHMLGCSKRNVNRHAERLGGLNVDGVNVFPASAILEHIEGRDA